MTESELLAWVGQQQRTCATGSPERAVADAVAGVLHDLQNWRAMVTLSLQQAPGAGDVGREIRALVTLRDQVRTRLTAAYHALESYAHGNASTVLAREIAASLRPLIAALTGQTRQDGSDAPALPLTDAQAMAVEDWASDDRLWTTPESTAFNLAVFARLILKLASEAPLGRSDAPAQKGPTT